MEVDYNLLPKDNYVDLVYNYIVEFKDFDLDTTSWDTESKQQKLLYQKKRRK